MVNGAGRIHAWCRIVYRLRYVNLKRLGIISMTDRLVYRSMRSESWKNPAMVIINGECIFILFSNFIETRRWMRVWLVFATLITLQSWFDIIKQWTNRTNKRATVRARKKSIDRDNNSKITSSTITLAAIEFYLYKSFRPSLSSMKGQRREITICSIKTLSPI